MRRSSILFTLMATTLAVPTLISTAWATPSPTAIAKSSVRSCDAPLAGAASCNAIVRTDAGAAPSATTGPAGYGPTDLRTAYALPSTVSGTVTHPVVAIVDAYDDPNAFKDLGVYRSTFGLSTLPACSAPAPTAAAACFSKVGQTGSATALPKSNGGWAQEISLDVDMVSASCEQCSILLVEANSSSFANLASAVVEAGTLGANVISNSYGGSESGSYANSYSRAGVAITVSTGDSGNVAPQSPASYPSVIAVGGTSLAPTSPRAETAWSGAGSYCSAIYGAMPGQVTYGSTEVAACASKRGAADISSDADPNTGVAVYDSLAYRGQSGWLVFGGTSVSSPFVGGAIGLAGTWANYGTSGGSRLYGVSTSFFDVVSGKNGSCAGSLCNAGQYWDGPTGLGSLNGTTGL